MSRAWLIPCLLIAVAAAAPAAERDEASLTHIRAWLERFDADHDGKLDSAERAAARQAFSARLKAHHPKLFAKADQDGNGQLSHDEMRRIRHHLREHREGGEGREHREGRKRG